MGLGRVVRGAGAADVGFGADLTERVHAPTALIGRRAVVVTSTNDHLLVLAILLDQTLVQFHALVLQFGASILLDFPLSLFAALLRIRIL